MLEHEVTVNDEQAQSPVGTGHRDRPEPRQYKFKIDCQEFHLPEARPTGAELLRLVKKRPCAYELIQELGHCANEVVEPDQRVDLSQPGREKFLTAHKKLVTITLNGKPYEVERGRKTVAEILRLAGQTPEAFMLLQEKDGPPMPVPPDAALDIAGCEVFYSQILSGASS